TVQPCVYWPGGGAPLDLLLELGADITNTESFAAARGVPSPCASCSYVEACGGGGAGRRRLLNALHAPDPYLPVPRGRGPPPKGGEGRGPAPPPHPKRPPHPPAR